MNTCIPQDLSTVGSWQEYFERSCSERVKTAIRRAVRTHQKSLRPLFERLPHEGMAIDRCAGQRREEASRPHLAGVEHDPREFIWLEIHAAYYSRWRCILPLRQEASGFGGLDLRRHIKHARVEVGEGDVG